MPEPKPSLVLDRLLAHRVKVILAAALVAAMGALGAGFGTGWLEDRARAELTWRAERAGLSLSVQKITVSPFGWVAVDGLRLRRPDGTMVLGVASVVASWRFTDLLRGRKMPEEVRILQPAADLRLVDGRPDEARDWWRRLRDDDGVDAPEPATGVAAPRMAPFSHLPERLEVRGAVLRLDLRGRYADLVPGGVLLHRVDIDWRRGQGGRLSGGIDRPAQGRMAGEALRTDAGLWESSLRFDPPFVVPLPEELRRPTGGDHLRVGGVGWTDARGAEIAGLQLLRGEVTLLEVGAAGGQRTPERSAWARGVTVHLHPEAPEQDRLGRLVGAWLGPAARGAAPGRITVRDAELEERRGLARTRRYALQLHDVRTVLPARLGSGRVSELQASLTTREGVAPRMRDLVVDVREPRLDLLLPARPAALPRGLEPLRSVARRLAPEAHRALASVPPGAARLQPGWQRPGTLSKAERRKLRLERTREQLKLERQQRRREREEKQAQQRREGPYTRRFVAPLQQLHDRLVAQSPEVSGALERLLGEGPHVHVQDGALVLAMAATPTDRVGLWRAGLDLKPTDEQGAGRARFETSVGDPRRVYGQFDLRAQLDDRGNLGPLRASAGGPELARLLRAAWPKVGLGAAPDLKLDLSVNIGRGASPFQLVGSVRSDGVGLDWDRFAPIPVTDLPLRATFSLRAARGPEQMRLDVSEARLGQALFTGYVTVGGARGAPEIDVRMEMPRQDCGVAAASIPLQLLPTIGAIKARGQAGWWMQLHLNLAQPYFSELDMGLDDKGCVVESFERIDVTEIDGPFKRKVNEDGFILDHVTIGPASGSWTPISQMPRWVPYAMMTTEDGSFYAHRGLNLFLLNRAIRLDLHYGRFVYGGSTLTQQLVKNLYMTRSKFLGRKLEELLIVWEMERKVPKVRILEVYTNGVEFGPGKYGITRGAAHYFDKSPSRLTPLEAAWLGSLKPCPGCADGHFRAQRYGPWYQKRLLEILTRMQYYGVISQAQYDREMNTVPRFAGWPSQKLSQRFSHPIPPRKVNLIDFGRRASEEDEEKLQAEAAEKREKMRQRILAREARLRELHEQRDLEQEKAEVGQRDQELGRLKQQGATHGARVLELARQQREARARLERIEQRRRADEEAARRRQDEVDFMLRQRLAIEAERRKRLGLPPPAAPGKARKGSSSRRGWKSGRKGGPKTAAGKRGTRAKRHGAGKPKAALRGGTPRKARAPARRVRARAKATHKR